MSQVKRIMVSLPGNLLEEVDDFAAADSQNRSEFIRKAMKLYIQERKRHLLREQMKKGYREMAKINLALAMEQYRLESEVSPAFEPATEGK
ncbi:MAG: ribbon-helix-helix protein, CopG family [Clostridiales bacterium]|nr:ribbon-helix-helix protein, CopG family [Clostridiales bacterium]MCF8023333.1 ribbon-helix-helix protein, CopG family [Clostridiales bacterium]